MKVHIFTLQTMRFCMMLHDLSLCTLCVPDGIVFSESYSTEYSGGIENRWCLRNKKGSSRVG